MERKYYFFQKEHQERRNLESIFSMHLPLAESMDEKLSEYILKKGARVSLEMAPSHILIPIEGVFQLSGDSGVQELYPGMVCPFHGAGVLTFDPDQAEELGRMYCLDLSFSLSEYENHAFEMTSLNKLFPIFDSGKMKLFMGVYEGRVSDSLELLSDENLVLVIHGVFEVEDRLLEMRDAMRITGTGLMEFESLGNNALLLVISS